MVTWSDPPRQQPARQPWFDIYLTIRVAPDGVLWRCSMTPYAADGTSGVTSRTAWRQLEEGDHNFDPYLFATAAIEEARSELGLTPPVRSQGNGA